MHPQTADILHTQIFMHVQHFQSLLDLEKMLKKRPILTSYQEVLAVDVGAFYP